MCSSERIYPKPTVTWSTEPPSNKTLQSKTTVEQTSPLLYSFTSTLKILPEDAGKIYICAVVSSEYGMNATMRVEGGRGEGWSFFLCNSKCQNFKKKKLCYVICTYLWTLRNHLHEVTVSVFCNLFSLLFFSGQLPVFGLSYVLVTSGIGFLTVLVVIAILSFRGKTRRYDTTTVPLRLLAF